MSNDRNRILLKGCTETKHGVDNGRITITRGGGGAFRVGENMNLQILTRQNLCHFLKMSEQLMCGSQSWLMRNSGCLLLLPAQILKTPNKLCTKFLYRI